MEGCGEHEARSISSSEKNNYKQGRSGSKCKINMGPAAGAKRGNPTSGGGINRSTRGTSQH